MGEEWRLGWHPEKVKRAKVKKYWWLAQKPCRTEATRVLGQMGHNVLLAEADRTLGGALQKRQIARPCRVGKCVIGV